MVAVKAKVKRRCRPARVLGLNKEIPDWVVIFEPPRSAHRQKAFVLILIGCHSSHTRSKIKGGSKRFSRSLQPRDTTYQTRSDVDMWRRLLRRLDAELINLDV